MNSICCIILSLAYLPQVIQSYNLKKGGLLWRILLRLRGDFEWFWNQSNLHLYTIEIHNPPGIPSNYQRMIGVTILSFGEPGSLQMLVRGRSLWSCISARFQVSSVYFSMYFHVSSLRESQPLTSTGSCGTRFFKGGFGVFRDRVNHLEVLMGTKAGVKPNNPRSHKTWLDSALNQLIKSATTHLKGLAVGIYGDMFLKKWWNNPYLAMILPFLSFAQPPPQWKEGSAIWPFPCLKIGEQITDPPLNASVEQITNLPWAPQNLHF